MHLNSPKNEVKKRKSHSGLKKKLRRPGSPKGSARVSSKPLMEETKYSEIQRRKSKLLKSHQQIGQKGSLKPPKRAVYSPIVTTSPAVTKRKVGRVHKPPPLRPSQSPLLKPARPSSATGQVHKRKKVKAGSRPRTSKLRRAEEPLSQLESMKRYLAAQQAFQTMQARA